MTRSTEDDDDRTIISTSFGDSDLPQFVSSSSMFNHTLPDGTRLGEFEIKGLIGEGGFGIVYLADDLSLQRQVALKEYMPSSLAARSSTTATVSVKSDRHRETFQAGLKSFVNEARLLAQFNHPALVKVYRFWEDHGTAYMVMPYYEGPTLKRALAELGQPASEAQIMGWLTPLLDALDVMHAAHCFHRDIAPDNILLTASGPLLLDFGAARRVIGDMTHALTVVLKPGYAPIEQYGEDASSMAQGAWTDLYALACVVYYAITGKAPMSSVDRLISDKLKPLSEVGAGRYSASFLQAIDATLAVRPEARPQSVAQFRALLQTPQPEPEADVVTIPLELADDPVPPTGLPQLSPVAAPAPRPAQAPAPASVALPGPAATRPRMPMVVAAAVALIGLAVLAWWLATPHPTASPPPAATTTPAPVQPEPVPPKAETPVAVPAAPEPAPSVAATPAEPAKAIEPVIPAPVAAVPAPVTPPPAKPAPASNREAKREAAPVPKRDATPAEIPQKMPPAPARHAAVQARCSDILQKASLETLSSEETAFLKKECR